MMDVCNDIEHDRRMNETRRPELPSAPEDMEHDDNRDHRAICSHIAIDRNIQNTT